jgi:hypothetical protein
LRDAFVAKLFSEGDHLWSSYLGGTSTEYGRDIAVDVSGSALVHGYWSKDWGSVTLTVTDEGGLNATATTTVGSAFRPAA